MSFPLVLASESPRRLALLAQAGIIPDAIVPAAIDESVRKAEMPRVRPQNPEKSSAEALAFIVCADHAPPRE